MQTQMRILYPFNPLKPDEADEPYQDEFTSIKNSGGKCSLFDFDSLAFDEFKPKPAITQEEVVLYRGWMLNPEKYQNFIGHIHQQGGIPITNLDSYTSCHHISEWYELCKEFTPETKFFQNDENLIRNAKLLNWPKYFVKDYVKSNSTERGSIANAAEEIADILELIETYRGSIEGGVALRAFEDFLKDTETRYFVFKGKVYSPGSSTPALVTAIAARIKSPFFSIDIAQKADGEFRLIEIGDGQVSDKKSWSAENFSKIFIDNA